MRESIFVWIVMTAFAGLGCKKEDSSKKSDTPPKLPVGSTGSNRDTPPEHCKGQARLEGNFNFTPSCTRGAIVSFNGVPSVGLNAADQKKNIEFGILIGTMLPNPDGAQTPLHPGQVFSYVPFDMNDPSTFGSNLPDSTAASPDGQVGAPTNLPPISQLAGNPFLTLTYGLGREQMAAKTGDFRGTVKIVQIPQKTGDQGSIEVDITVVKRDEHGSSKPLNPPHVIRGSISATMQASMEFPAGG